MNAIALVNKTSGRVDNIIMAEMTDTFPVCFKPVSVGDLTVAIGDRYDPIGKTFAAALPKEEKWMPTLWNDTMNSR